MVNRADRLIELYERGVITRPELIGHLVDLADACPVEPIAANLPGDVLATLRDQSSRPPASVEDCPRRFQFGGSPSLSEDDGRRLWFSGIWRWHRYFAGA